jgi:hypothetical protein
VSSITRPKSTRTAPHGGGAGRQRSHPVACHRLRAATLTALLLGGAGATPSLAVDVAWVGATGLPPGDGTTFDSPLNWFPAMVPGPNDRAIFSGVGGTIFLPGVAASNARLLISGPPSGVLFNLNAGIYQLTDPGTAGDALSLVVGLGPGDAGDLTLFNGTTVAESAGIGELLGASGALTVEGDSVLLLSNELGIGREGQGELTLLGTLVSGAAAMGAAISGNAQATIESDTGLWLALGPITLAESGTAELNVINVGKLVATAGVTSAVLTGSSATILIRDSGSIMLVTGGMVVGGDSVGSGGSVLVSVDNGGLLRVTPDLIVRIDGTLDIVQSTVETPELRIDGGDAIVNVAGTLVVSEVGSTTEVGIFVGMPGGSGVLAVENGGTLLSSEGAVSPTANSQGILTLAGMDSVAQFSGTLTIGGDPQPLERGGLRGLVSVSDGAQLEVNSGLVVGQRGTLELLGGTAEAQVALLGDEGRVAIELPQKGTAITSTLNAEVGGGLFITLAGSPPLVGDTVDVLFAPFIAGSIAVVSSPNLAGDRAVALQQVAIPGGEALRLEVELLPSGFSFAKPGATDLDLPPADVVVTKFDEADELPQAGISVPAATPTANGSVEILANTAPPNQQPSFNVVAAVEVGNDPGSLVQGSLFNSRGRRGPKPDLAVSNRGSSSITLIRNNTPPPGADAQGPLFVVEGEYPVGGTPGGLSIADIDGDGTPAKPDNDIAVAVASAIPQEQGYIAIFYNIGGIISDVYQEVLAGIDPQTVCPIDTTGDKVLDLVAVNFGLENPTEPIEGPCVTVHFNFGNGSFCDPPKVYEVGGGPIDAAAADFNDDGHLDVVTANSIDGTISVLVGQELEFALICQEFEPFKPAVDLDAGGIPIALAVGAFNLLPGEKTGDEDIDIAIVVEDPITGEQSLNVFRNDSAYGQIVFTLLTDVQSLIGVPSALAASDTDGDGTPDLISVGEDSGNGVAGAAAGFISVYLAVPTCPGDLAGDGQVDGADLGAILGAWGHTGPNVPEDINGDGIVDAADLGLLLQNWGACGS